VLDGVEQSRININHTGQLSSVLNRSYLAILLFVDEPAKVLLAGLGGGEFVRFLHFNKPDMHGDVLEINSVIAGLARLYFDYPAVQWPLTVMDIQHWQGRLYDFIVVDIANGDLTPDWISSEKMLLQFKQQLSKTGVLAINFLVDDAAALSRSLMQLRQVFNGKTVCLTVPDFKNIVVFAFNQSPPYRSRKDMQSRVVMLSESWGVDFAPLLQQLFDDNPVGSGVL